MDEVLYILLCSNLDGDKRLSASVRVARIRPKSRTNYAMLASLACGNKHSISTSDTQLHVVPLPLAPPTPGNEAMPRRIYLAKIFLEPLST